MSDDKKSHGVADIDWDQALSEWEKTSFVPEVAKDVGTDKPAALGGGPPPRPLYRPPTVSPAVRPKLPPPPPRAPGADDDEGSNATVITKVPDNLLGDHRARMVALELETAGRPPLPTLSFEDDVDSAMPRDDIAAPLPSEEIDFGSPPEGTTKPELDDMAISPLPEMRSWPEERPAKESLSLSTRQALEARAEWLEQEARALEDNEARGRALLACSEIRATLGEIDLARALAEESRDTAPSLPLAHGQARLLMDRSSFDSARYVAALEAEVRMARTSPARVHAMLLAADLSRAERREDAAAKFLEGAAGAGTPDVRAAVARAADALARDDVGHASLHLAASSDLLPIAEALSACLRHRGVDRDGTAAGPGSSPSEVLLRARQALGRGDVGAGASLAAELAMLPELAGGAKWLAASLAATQTARRADSARWLHELAEQGDEDARRAFLVRLLELGDVARLAEMIGKGGLVSAERVTLCALAGLPLVATDAHLDATASTSGMQVLAAALTALAMPTDGDRDADVEVRGQRTAGSDDTRARVRLGRLLSASASTAQIDLALACIDDPAAAGGRVIALEMASRAGRASDVSTALEDWGRGEGSHDEQVTAALAAALVAERARNRPRALEAFKAARAVEPSLEAALRAIASLEPVDLVAEMNELAAELREGPRSAMARIEAAARGLGLLPEPTRAHMLQEAHNAAPALPIASFLAERMARRTGDIDEVLRWVRERRTHSADPIEEALDCVREALLIADRDSGLAGERLREAHQTRPSDVALRELCERMGSESANARALWREQRAGEAAGDTRVLFLLEASNEYERAGDYPAALRCAEAAGADNASLASIVRERAETRSRHVDRLGDALLATAKGADDTRSRREAYERLALLDVGARQDSASALLRHRAILEEFPGYQPSLRHLEHHFIGAGDDDELELVATAIAVALRGGGAGECTAHAELAARLRMRGADARWDAGREMVDLAAAETDPSLWSLRMLVAHARSRGDDETLLAGTLRLLERISRPAESATLLVRAGETAARLVRLAEARTLLERATVEDSGDVVAWTLLAEVCRRAGDARGAAETCEALARSSLVPEHSLRAWHEAGCIWLDDANDPDRAILALEAAGAIDVAYRDVFDRLSHLYASRKMVAELAELLERRISGITDTDERLAMEVTRGRVLLEASDVDGARRAFKAALAERPEDTGALSAFANLCLSESDWEAAEHALVQLTRLLPTPDEQRDVYARLGDLYAVHLPNLSRAEVALREVLKRAPGDIETTQKLVTVYKRQSDSERAAELQQSLISKARSPEEKRDRILELAIIQEQIGHDNRRAEQTLEAARREFPQDVILLRALAEFYARHHQAPAVNILLDRAGGDARRALTAGRVSSAIFHVLGTVSELRGKKDGALVAKAMLAALSGLPAEIGAAGHRAFESSLDDLLAPEGFTLAVRGLLAKTGDALDQITPVDVRGLKTIPSDAPLVRLAASVAQAIGIGAVQMFMSPKLGSACVPAGSSPPTIVVGEALSGDERFAAFLLLRALKIVQARASALVRMPPADLSILVIAWLKCFNPTWQVQGPNPALVNAMGGRLQAVLPRRLPPDIAVTALEAAADIGAQAPTLGARAAAWADRVALLALGDCNAALDAIATTAGAMAGAPRDPKERTSWVARTPAARDLVAFAVTDAFGEARARLGV